MNLNNFLSPKTFVSVSLIVLGGITILNLNGLASMRFGAGNVLSPAILLMSITIIVSVPKRLVSDAMPTLKYYYYFIFFYVLYGALVAFARNADSVYLVSSIRSNIASIVIVTAATFGFMYYARNVNRLAPLHYVYLLAMVSIGSIFYGRFDPTIYRYVRVEDLYESRFSGFFANPNEAGMAVCVSAAFCLYYIAKRQKVIVNIGLLALMGIAVFLTFSRAAWIVFVLIVFVYLVSLSVTRGKRSLAMGTILLGGLLVLSMAGRLMEGGNWNRIQQQRITSMMDIVGSGVVSAKETKRVDLLSIAGSMIVESPIVGHGLGALHAMPKAKGMGAHNSFLVIQGEAGIMGSLLFVLFLVKVMGRTFRIEDVALRRLVFSYMFVFLCMMFFTHNGLTHRNHNYYLGIMLAVVCLVGNKNNASVRRSI